MSCIPSGTRGPAAIATVAHHTNERHNTIVRGVPEIVMAAKIAEGKILYPSEVVANTAPSERDKKSAVRQPQRYRRYWIGSQTSGQSVQSLCAIKPSLAFAWPTVFLPHSFWQSRTQVAATVQVGSEVEECGKLELTLSGVAVGLHRLDT